MESCRNAGGRATDGVGVGVGVARADDERVDEAWFGVTLTLGVLNAFDPLVTDPGGGGCSAPAPPPPPRLLDRRCGCWGVTEADVVVAPGDGDAALLLATPLRVVFDSYGETAYGDTNRPESGEGVATDTAAAAAATVLLPEDAVS